MNRRWFGLLLLLHSIAAVNAQVQIQSLLPGAGIVQKTQLWNLVLVNGSAGELNGRLELRLRDRETGLEVMTATTQTITLKKGATVFQESHFLPIQYQYNGISPDASLHSLLPVGKYIACYTYINFLSGHTEFYTEECFSFDVEALAPPMLIYPADSSRLQLAPAQFSWTPPAPLPLFKNLRYELLVAEVYPGQQAAEALQENLPAYNLGNLAGNVWNLLSTSSSLEKKKWYAWQVIARDDDKYAGKSETWLFYITDTDSNRLAAEALPYTVLSADPQRVSYIPLHGSKISLKHYSYLPKYEGKIEIADPQGNIVHSIKQVVMYGDNYLHITIDKKLEQEKIHTLSLIDENGKKHSVLFSINDQN